MMAATLTEQIHREDLDAISRPALEAFNLPPHYYTSPEIYELELAQVFHRTWFCVGRADEIPAIGDELVRPVDTDTVTISRASAEEIVADGGFRVEVWEGFIFLNGDPGAAPVSASVTDLPKWNAERYAFADERSMHRFVWDAPANWKLLIDNFVEEYHVAWVHAESFQPTMPMKKWMAQPELSGDEPWSYMMGEFPGMSMGVEGPALFPMIPTLGERERSGMAIFTLFPNLMMIVAVDCLIYYFALPTGVESARVIAHLCLPAPVAERVRSGEPEFAAAFEEYVENTKLILDEDVGISDFQACGLRSRHARPGRLCKHELLLSSFHKWLTRTAYEPAIEPPAA